MLRLLATSRALAARSSLVLANQQPRVTAVASFPSRARTMTAFFSTTTPVSSENEASKDTSATAAAAEDTLNVPKNYVRYLIGFKGRTLASLSERSGGAKILFTKQETQQGEEVAKITGDAEQVAKMKELVLEELQKIKDDPKVQEAEKSRNDPKVAAPAAPNGSRRNENDYMEEVIVDAQYVGFLIGKEGTVLKDMETSTGARIQYSNRDTSDVERTARIRGSPSQVQAAKKLISDKIFAVAEEIRSGKRGNRGPRSNQVPRGTREPSPNDVKQVVEVPSECVGALIGKGGKSLFQMQDKTGAKFNFAKEDHRDGAREVTIYGSEDQIRSACDMLQQRVRQVLDRNSEQTGEQ